MNFILIEKTRRNLAKTMLSLLILISLLFSIGPLTLNMGIEFTGGVAYSLSTPVEQTKKEFETILGVAISGNALNSTIHMVDDSALHNTHVQYLEKYLLSRDTIGASLGKELINASMFGMGLAFLGVMLYLSFRYNSTMALAALVALAHDIAFTMFALAILKIEMSSIVVGALLAIIGYSINDSVVTLDRIRELIKTNDKNPIASALKMTLRRNVITAVSTLIVITALFALGGEAMKAFSITMLTGVGAGMFSSLTIVPFLVSIKKRKGGLKISKTPSLEGEL